MVMGHVSRGYAAIFGGISTFVLGMIGCWAFVDGYVWRLLVLFDPFHGCSFS